jgi:hypothetical protein
VAVEPALAEEEQQVAAAMGLPMGFGTSSKKN